MRISPLGVASGVRSNLKAEEKIDEQNRETMFLVHANVWKEDLLDDVIFVDNLTTSRNQNQFLCVVWVYEE